MVRRVEWDKTVASIYYTKKLDRFARLTYTEWNPPGLERHHSVRFWVKMDLILFLDSVFDADSEKKSFNNIKKEQSKKFCIFRKDCDFFEKRHLSSISHFST